MATTARRSFGELLYHFVRRQVSDLPWLVVGWCLGLVVEGAVLLAGLTTFSPWWIFWLKVIGLYGFVMGYLAFVIKRSPLGFVVGGVIGVAYLILLRHFMPLQSWDASVTGLPFDLLWVLWAAVLPPLIDRIADPHLMRGPFLWLAAYHPRNAHLRK